MNTTRELKRTIKKDAKYFDCDPIFFFFFIVESRVLVYMSEFLESRVLVYMSDV